MLITFLVMVALSLVVYGTRNFQELKSFFFDPNAAAVLTTKGEAATTLEEKVDFLVESQLLFTRKFKRRHDSSTSIATIANWRTAAIVLPIVIMGLALIYLATKCYPRAVFLWGDWEDRFAKLLERRRFVWNAIIVALVIEIVAFFFGMGLST